MIGMGTGLISYLLVTLIDKQKVRPNMTIEEGSWGEEGETGRQ